MKNKEKYAASGVITVVKSFITLATSGLYWVGEEVKLHELHYKTMCSVLGARGWSKE